MDFSLTQQQQSLRESVLAFAREQLQDDFRQREKHEAFFRDGWERCAEFGLTGLPVPEDHGGKGLDIVACMIAMQALAYGCPDSGLVFALCSHMWTSEVPLMLFGSEGQKERFLPRMAKGELIGCHAMTEPDAGSDAFSIRTLAVEQDDGAYLLNGTKSFVSNAPIADLFLVFATIDPKRGWAGVTGFLIERDTPGFSVGEPLAKMGLKTSPTSPLTLQDVRVEPDMILGRVGRGSAIFNAEMEWERSCLFAAHLGAMQRQLDACVQHAKSRKQFGKPIGSNQAISHKIADMRLRIELGELILHKVAWLKASGKRAQLQSAIAKLFVSEAYVQSSLDAIQIHGGHGYLSDNGIERDLRDAVGSRIYSGTSEIQRNIIASLLGL